MKSINCWNITKLSLRSYSQFVGNFQISAACGWALTIEFCWPKLAIEELERLFTKETLTDTSPRKQCLLHCLKQTNDLTNFANGRIEIDLPFEVLSDQRFLEMEILSQNDKRFLVATLTRRVIDAPQLKKEIALNVTV